MTKEQEDQIMEYIEELETKPSEGYAYGTPETEHPNAPHKPSGEKPTT